MKEYLVKIYDDSCLINPTYVIHEFSKRISEIEDSLELKKLQNLLSNTYYHANNIDSALFLNQEIIDFCEKTERSSEVIYLAGDAYNNRGVLSQHSDRRDTAIICYKKAYELLNSISEMQLLPTICINLGDCYFTNGDYTQTSIYYRRALFITDSLGIGNELHPAIYSGLAQLYQELGNYVQAEDYFSKAEKYWDSKTEREKFYFANTRGNHFYNVKKYPEALIWFRKANISAKTLAQFFPLAITEGNMGEIFLLMNEKDSARYYLNNAKSLLGSYYELPSFKFYFEGLFASLAILENDLQKAEELLLQPYDTVYVTPQLIYAHNKRLQSLYEKKQDYKKAYHYNNIAIAYDDSVRNAMIQNNIEETTFRFKQDTTLMRKDFQIMESEYKTTQWKKATVLSLILFFLFTLFVIGFILYRRRMQELKHQRQLSTIASLRMEVVRNRLSPHFVFNALNAILPSLDKYAELEQPFRLLIQLLRNNLRASEQIAVPLEEEIKIVTDYLELQAFRNSDMIPVNWHIEDNIPIHTLIPSMSIQIPVENAVKYAFNDTTPGPTIEIQIAVVKDSLSIEIEDNGIGYTPGQTSNDLRGTGNGIKMLYKTIDLLNSRNEKKINFKIENLSNTTQDKKGTKVSLAVPLKFEFEL